MTPKTCDNHRQRDKQINRLKREYIMYELENKTTNNKVVLVLKKINKIYICLNQIQMSYNEAHEQSIIDKYCIVDSYEIEEIVSMRT